MNSHFFLVLPTWVIMRKLHAQREAYYVPEKCKCKFRNIESSAVKVLQLHGDNGKRFA